jgi:type VI secretion system protein ImpA
MIGNQSYNELVDRMKLIESVGVDCRVDPHCKQLYREAKDARAEARHIERQFYKNEGEDTSHHYWTIVCEHALTLLLDHTRDIEVMSWLLESLCRLDGYQGCAFSFTVISLFTAKFSNQLYPHAQEDDPDEWKWMSLAGLNGEESQGSLIIPLNSIKICLDPAVALWQYQHLYLSQNNSHAPVSTIALTMQQLFEHIIENGPAFLIQTLQDCDSCLESFEKMADTLFSKLDDSAPPTNRIKESLEKAKSDLVMILHQIFGEDVLSKKAISTTEAPEAHLESLPMDTVATSKGGMNRSKAIATIQDVANFFQNTEPHSPIPYMLRRVIAWSALSWPELMQTMVHNKDEIENIISQTGMPVE